MGQVCIHFDYDINNPNNKVFCICEILLFNIRWLFFSLFSSFDSVSFISKHLIVSSDIQILWSFSALIRQKEKRCTQF